MKPGNVIQHHSGMVYTVIETTTNKVGDDWVVTVLYISAGGNRYTRIMSEMREKFTILYDGTEQL